MSLLLELGFKVLFSELSLVVLSVHGGEVVVLEVFLVPADPELARLAPEPKLVLLLKAEVHSGFILLLERSWLRIKGTNHGKSFSRKLILVKDRSDSEVKLFTPLYTLCLRT